MKDLKDKVVVITGASSGIGRATAMEFARQGAKVILAGRDASALREAATEIETQGGIAEPVLADVTNEEQVEHLASRAEENYGRIDIWVNNAGVSLFAKFEDAPADDYRRVIETDFFGYVNGARAALKRFKAQGEGTLINVDSIEGVAPKPYNSAYSAAKHAVRALASSLRMELALDGAKNINVCTVMPASVDTPLFAHAANYTGQSISASTTSTTPESVAKTITKLAHHPQREVMIGSGNSRGSVINYLFAPKSYEKGTSKSFPRHHLTSDSADPGQGNLYEATGPHAISGGWRPEKKAGKARQVAPFVALGGLVTLGSLAAWLFWPGQNRASGLKRLVPKHR